MNFDLTFPASYRMEMVPDFPGYAVPNLFYFPPRGTGGSEGGLLRIAPENGDVWMGCFSPFTRTPTLISSAPTGLALRRSGLFRLCSKYPPTLGMVVDKVMACYWCPDGERPRHDFVR